MLRSELMLSWELLLSSRSFALCWCHLRSSKQTADVAGPAPKANMILNHMHIAVPDPASQKAGPKKDCAMRAGITRNADRLGAVDPVRYQL